MEKRAIFILGFLIIFSSGFAQAYTIGVDYPGYEVYHGHWEGGECIACEPIHFEDDTIDSNNIPVILVHGWGNSANLQNTQDKEWGDLQNKLRQLEDEGFDIWRLDYAPANLSNRKNAGIVAEAINEILNKGYKNQGVEKVYIVAHSMGGLAVRGYIQNMGIDEFGNPVSYEDNIGKIVLTGSPQYGSYFANIIDGITPIDLPTDHPSCQEVVEGNIYGFEISPLTGNSEATLDLEFGSDFTWELNQNGLNQDIDFLTIAGKYPIGILLSPAKDYCLHNEFETNDGVVSLISANFLKFDVPLVIFNEPHVSPDGLNKDDDVGFLINLFFKDEMNYESAYGNMFTGLNSLEGEVYYNPFESKKDTLPTELTSKGSFLLDTHFSEVEINDNSLKLDVNIDLERNKNSGKWFYIDLDSDASQKILDFTTMLSTGGYDLYVNGINSKEEIEILSGSVNLVSFEFDSDRDNFDVENVGGTDCDDSRDLTYPGAFETCNLIDDNCYLDVEDDGINETWFNESTKCGIGECRRQGAFLCLTGEKADTCTPGEPTILLNSVESKDSNCDGLIGDIENANENLSLTYERNNTTLMFNSEGRRLIEFEHDVFNESLNILNLSIKKQDQNSTESYVIVRGLDLGNSTKTLYLDILLNGTGICIKDAEINSVDEISNDCKGENEFWMSCPGTNGDYACNLSANNFQYILSGLKHSGIKEQETYCGDSICNGAESCSSCSIDCGSCPVETGGSSGGGGGGGGGEGSSSTTKKTTTIEDNETILEIGTHTETTAEENETSEEENTEQGSSFITGAVIGSALNEYKFPLAFVVLVAGLGLFVFIKRRKKNKEIVESTKSQLRQN